MASLNHPMNIFTPTTTAIPQVTWHLAVLWFLGGVALIAVAEPAPTVAIWLLIVLIIAVLLKNWPDYKSFLGMS